MPAGRAIVVGSYAVGLTMRTDVFPVPGETRLGYGFAEGPGGKGSNQAIGLARHHARVVFVGCLGDDRFGRDALDLLTTEGVDASGVAIIPGESTGIGFIVLDGIGRNLIVLDPGANRLLDASSVGDRMGRLGPEDVVLTQLEISEAAAAAALDVGRAAGATTILNPAPARPIRPETLAAVDVLTPNETELRILAGVAPDAPADDAQLALGLLAQGVRAVVVTRGAAGALVVTKAGRESIKAPRADVLDSTGAGDAFNAALAAHLLAGEDLALATRFAVTAGALACTRMGVVPSLPTKAEVDRAMTMQPGILEAKPGAGSR
jgi:ribokinase